MYLLKSDETIISIHKLHVKTYLSFAFIAAQEPSTSSVGIPRAAQPEAVHAGQTQADEETADAATDSRRKRAKKNSEKRAKKRSKHSGSEDDASSQDDSSVNSGSDSDSSSSEEDSEEERRRKRRKEEKLVTNIFTITAVANPIHTFTEQTLQ